jgi:hydrogenase-4 component B
MEAHGGLIRRMPATAFYFLIGAIAISGLPPLNGFVSEWLTYQALLAGFGTTSSLTRLMFPIAGSLLALTAALAAACFVKAFGIPFLALPRSEASANAVEAGGPMRFAMAVLAGACIALGLGATWVVRLFDPITEQALGIRVSPYLAGGSMALQAGSARAGGVSTAGIAIVFVVFGGVLAGLVAWRLRRARVVCGAVWDCGLPGLTAENEYTATAFSKPLRMIFAAFYRPRREIQPEYDVSPYYPSAIRFESEIEPTFEKHVYGPLKSWTFAISRRMRGIQAGSIHAYLAYIFVTLIVLLLFGVRQ